MDQPSKKGKCTSLERLKKKWKYDQTSLDAAGPDRTDVKGAGDREADDISLADS